MAVQTRGSYPQLYDNVDKTIDAVLFSHLKELEPIWRQVFNVKDSGVNKFVRVMGEVEFSDVPEKPEGEAYTTDLLRPGHVKDFTHVEFGMGFEVTETSLEDDQYDRLTRNAELLAFAARVVEEKRAANIFNNGFTTENSPDGVTLFHSSHVLAGGGTARNQLATAADLSATSLQQALIDLQSQTKTERNNLAAPITDLILYVPPDLEFTADRLLNSVGLPQSADNDRNPIKSRRQWKLIVNPYLTDTDAWFVLAANKKLHGLRSYTRVPITRVPPMTDARTGNRIYKIRFRRSWGAAFWQNVFGSAGA